ncbi:hypothetical protein [Flavobacterium gyeonganense]|uniref:Uncharacterized protein n=1 Tax=Flavobacterium gyeonganense TaxID=1310418 RepID=A0ABV5H880_9FLAO|nr:hypothetical protein [Flavobacterium gyeonganense]
MKKNKNGKTEKTLLITHAQAKTALSLFWQDPEKLKLEKGIAALLEKLKNPAVNKIFYNYPDLLQQYDLEELLSGNLEIPDTNKQDVKTAGIISCLQVLVYFCYDLKENPNPAHHQFDSLRYILKSITASEFINELLLIVITVTGVDYYKKYRQKIQHFNFDTQNAILLESDPELQEHFDLMVWFAMTRLFTESVYVYFSDPDQNLKTTKL